jgi:signal peptidase I
LRPIPKPLRVAGIGLMLVVAIPVTIVVLFFAVVIPLSLAGVTHEWRIPSTSMEPTLPSMDRVVSLKYFSSDPKRGDIVAFHAPPAAAQQCGVRGYFIKRVIGLPGERWSERNGFVYIDGARMDESYIEPSRRDDFTEAPVKLGPDEYFVMGDNRAASCDSRNWGPLPRHDIVGKVVLTWWPPWRLALH